MAKGSVVWTTEKVNDALEELRFGGDINSTCFHEGDFELKGANVFFQLTQEEEDEFIKCSQDVQHFVETYCRFLTDSGRRTVQLRDFQEDILNTLGEERWIESLEDFGPETRNYILMASRQTGKCLSFDTQLVIKNNLTKGLIKTTVGELYNLVNKHNKKGFKQIIIYKIKMILYKLYQKLS